MRRALVWTHSFRGGVFGRSLNLVDSQGMSTTSTYGDCQINDAPILASLIWFCASACLAVQHISESKFPYLEKCAACP